MKLMFIGADHEVTGSCHYLEAAGLKILVDCGMKQGVDYFENAELPVSYSEIDYVLLTHAHIDQCRDASFYLCERIPRGNYHHRSHGGFVQYHAEGQRAYPGIRGGVEEQEGQTSRAAGRSAAV